MKALIDYNANDGMIYRHMVIIPICLDALVGFIGWGILALECESLTVKRLTIANITSWVDLDPNEYLVTVGENKTISEYCFDRANAIPVANTEISFNDPASYEETHVLAHHSRNVPQKPPPPVPKKTDSGKDGMARKVPPITRPMSFQDVDGLEYQSQIREEWGEGEWK